jgi:4-hydroxyphenylpyruvate dioxygenase
MDDVRRTEPDIRIDVPDMPPRIAADGVEFVEFAADAGEAEDLVRLLSNLGFSRAGRHISKEVELWRQGDINVVVNTEPEGFAHSAYVMHGLSVCDIGLRVEDAAATVERARALGAETFRQARGPGELDIPAIRGVGGGVMRFIDGKTDLAKVWEIEFRPAGEAGAVFEVVGTGEGKRRDAGLTRIDHLAQTMNYEEMLTWTLFYTSIFDVRKAPTVDVVDPGGLVRSRAIESPDGALRLTLNGAESHRTLAGRFIADSFGSSVQHIAFATDDIFATAAALAEGGLATLSISPNYYDDLVARFEIPADAIARLRAAHILYDRDDNGAFFQLYTEPFGDGMFFEIVERRDGYAGYGAANAPFRIAAQKRAMRHAAVPRR